MSEETNVSEPKRYEIAYVLASAEAEKEIRDTLASCQCAVLHSGGLAAIKLAYPLKKHATGFFGFTVFAGAPEHIKGMKDALALKLGILRSLIITPPVKVATRGERAMRTAARAAATVAAESPMPVAPIPETLSNEGLEKKLEEILK